MKRLEEFFRHLSGGLIIDQDGKPQVISQTMLDSIAFDLHVFQFVCDIPSSLDGEEFSSLSDDDLPDGIVLPMPFPTISVEIAADKELLEFRAPDWAGIPPNKIAASIHALCVIKEIRPGEYEVISLERNVFKEFSGLGEETLKAKGLFYKGFPAVSGIQYQKRGPVKRALLGVVKQLLDRLQTENVCEEAIRFRAKVRREGVNHHIKIRKVIHVTPHRLAERGPYGGKITYKFRHEYRSHWLRIKGLGKDRNGVRCVPNFTWRRGHVRGPDDAPILRKVRVADLREEAQIK